MEEFENLLDTGITMEKNEATITLDFRKIFQREKMKDDTLETSLFSDLSQSHFKELIEHPLCQTFLFKKFDKKVIWYFVFFIMLPHMMFSTIYSLYSGVFFGYLCVPKNTTSTWILSERIPCVDVEMDSKEVAWRISLIRNNIKCQILSEKCRLCSLDSAHLLPPDLCCEGGLHSEDL